MAIQRMHDDSDDATLARAASIAGGVGGRG